MHVSQGLAVQSSYIWNFTKTCVFYYAVKQEHFLPKIQDINKIVMDLILT